MHSIIHLLADARRCVDEDLKIARALGNDQDLDLLHEMLNWIRQAEITVWSDDWEADTLDLILAISEFVHDHRTI